ncbi:LiaI-LiaF-like domain-containing protein [Anaerolentibacter hominis]|uniref:LiaI-LiaF-like domain-containing protein n=1 Tax=Anaerolentibacter hominis TaxID=3079009 RepID=UPI0031B89361
MNRVHRVGTFTFGILLVVFGLLFLLHLFIPALSYEIIFAFWPLIFILLGVEVLFFNFKQKTEKIIYDKGAVVLTVLLTFFAMIMACVDMGIQAAKVHSWYW